MSATTPYPQRDGVVNPRDDQPIHAAQNQPPEVPVCLHHHDDDTIHSGLPPQRCGPNRGETVAVVLVAVGATIMAMSLIGGICIAILATTR